MSDSFAPIIDSIYDAAFDQTLWRGVVKSIGEASGGFGGALVLFDADKRYLQVTHNQAYSPEFWHDYSTHYVALDPRVQAFHTRPEIEIYTDALLVSREVIRTNEVLNLARKESDQRHAYGARLFSSNRFEASLFLGRTESQGEAQQADLDRLALFLPHLRRSLAMARKIGERISAEAFDALPFGIVILDDSSRVSFVNKAATRIALSNDGVSLSSQTVTLWARDENAVLERAVRAHRTGSHLEIGQRPKRLQASRPSGLRPYHVTIYPLPSGQMVTGPHNSTMICITDPHDVAEVQMGSLMDLYGLTPAESALTLSLMQLGSLPAAAAACGIKDSSARQYLKRVHMMFAGELGRQRIENMRRISEARQEHQR